MSANGLATVLIQLLVTSLMTAQPLTEIVKFAQAPAQNAMQWQVCFLSLLRNEHNISINEHIFIINLIYLAIHCSLWKGIVFQKP